MKFNNTLNARMNTNTVTWNNNKTIIITVQVRYTKEASLYARSSEFWHCACKDLQKLSIISDTC